MTLPFLIRQSHVFLLYLLLLTIRIACMTISTRRPTIKNWSSRFTFSASSCPIFPPSFCLNLPVLSQHKENKSGGREHEEMMTSLHQRVSRGLSVSHKQVSQSQETHYCCQTLPNIISRRFLFGWFWSINSDFRSCSKIRQEKIFIGSWWPFPPSASLVYLDDVFLFSASPWQDLKTKKKVKKQQGDDKRKRWFSAMKNIEEQLKQRNEKISTIGRTKGSKERNLKNNWFLTSGLVCSKKKRQKKERWLDAPDVPRARSMTTECRMRSSTRVKNERRVCCNNQFLSFLTNSNDNFWCSKYVPLPKKFQK